MSKLLVALCLALAVWAAPAMAEVEEETWEVTLATRKVDLTSHLARQSVSLSITNVASRPLTSFYVAVDSIHTDKVAYVGAKIKPEGSAEPTKLVVTSSPLRGKKGVEGYLVRLPAPVQPQGNVKVEVETVYTEAVAPFPTEISQNEKQLVQFTGNAYMLSPYTIKSQSTIVTLPTTTIESFSRVAPTSTSENEVTYGPYNDQPPFSSARVTVHYENNGPFLTVESLERLIEVSHWGNIAVEEHVHVQHTGATLKGSYSRFDYQRIPNSGVSSVKSYVTLLPAASSDVYYRDEIGNISTSHLRTDEDYVELELRPRFPLFGGWQTRYYIGYNIPSYEYLYHSGSQYLLKMRLVDHVMDDQIINHLTLRIVLPEGAKNIALKAPYPVEQKENELLKTYLDTMGRPVVVLTKDFLVEHHIEDFELTYEYASWMLLQEPLLVVAALYGFFLFIIFVVRLDFSITKDVVMLAKQQASVTMDKILGAHDQRTLLIGQCQDSITAFKQSKDLQVFQKTRKSLEDKMKSCTVSISQLLKELQSMETEGYVKVSELQKKAGELKALIEDSCRSAEALVAKRITKPQYVADDKKQSSRIQRLQQETDAIVKTL